MRMVYKRLDIKHFLIWLCFLAGVFISQIVFANDPIGMQGQKSVYATMEEIVVAFNGLDSVDISSEIWLQSSDYRETFKFENILRNENYKLEGRMSYSKIDSSGKSFSSSSWVQQYYVRGLSFIWKDSKKNWERGAALIENDKKIKNELLKNLFSLNLEAINPESFQFMGYTKKDDADCFVIRYEVDSNMIKRWYSYGFIEGKLWVDKKTLLPLSLRLTGTLEGMDFLQEVRYKNYNQGENFVIPEAIVENLKLKEKYFEEIVKRLIEYVSKVRGWDVKALSEINVKFINRKQFKEKIVENSGKDNNIAQIKHESEIFKWLNLIPQNSDYKELIENTDFKLRPSFYDKKNKTIFIGDWLETVQAEMACLREVVHVFQDKNIDLNKFLDRANYTYDQSAAQKALIEGEAYAISLEYILNKIGESFLNTSAYEEAIDAVISNEFYLRSGLLSNMYVYGTEFVCRFVKRYDWIKLNDIYKNSPVSMKEIMHPEYYIVKYDIGGGNNSEAQFAPEELSPSFTNWERVYLTSLGEYPLFLFFNKFFSKRVAIDTVSGWSGDSLSIYQNNEGEKFFFYIVKWDKEKYALNFFEKYKELLKNQYSSFDKEGKVNFIPLADFGNEVKEVKVEGDNKHNVVPEKGKTLGDKPQEEGVNAVIFYSPKNEEKTVFKIVKDCVILIWGANVKDEEFNLFIQEIRTKPIFNIAV